ncbi:hypothetical protein GCM10008957_08360 [Deinococcus ruber]|uniref:Uncharacterized protein n=1 Tax=Deinococcus ruber TaxID=1848197 RepID=A0A918BYE2_9DEIO|nr:hypothetical protein GCM10008957_08360 [Deinococcus ruber]
MQFHQIVGAGGLKPNSEALHASLKVTAAFSAELLGIQATKKRARPPATAAGIWPGYALGS